jgi:tRNA A37 threonylcarbamoyltransferase TsaD
MTYLHDGHQHDTVGDTGVNTLVVVGGVAANSELRRYIHISSVYIVTYFLSWYFTDRRITATVENFNTEIGNAYNGEKNKLPGSWKVLFPPPALCTDNGAMVAWAGIEKQAAGLVDDPTGLDVIPRWPLGSLIDRKNDSVFKKIKLERHYKS